MKQPSIVGLALLGLLIMGVVGDEPQGDARVLRGTKAAKDKKVLILGGGMAGVAAARSLWDAGYRQFVVIEGRDALGGRVRAASLGGKVIEEGANWIHGRKTGTRPNPLWIYANAVNLQTAEENENSDVTFQQGSSTPVPDSQLEPLWQQFDTAYGCFDDLRWQLEKTKQADVSAKELWKRCGWAADSRLRTMVEWVGMDFDYGVSLDVTGSIGKPQDWQGIGGSDFFVTDSRGYVEVVKEVARPFLNDASKFLFNSRVTKVEYSASSVKVTVQDSSKAIKTYTGDFAVVTFSQGVLQRSIGRFNGATDLVKFSPSLPEWKKNAIDKISLGHYFKFFMKFPSRFWQNKNAMYFASSKRGQFPAWANLDFKPAFDGSHILLGTLTGQQGKEAASRTLEDLTAEAMTVLRSMYPGAPDPTEVFASRWATDEWTYGSYSSYDMNTVAADGLSLAYPVGKTLYFAGEATIPVHYGTLHGALLSGQRVGKEVMECAAGRCKKPRNK